MLSTSKFPKRYVLRADESLSIIDKARHCRFPSDMPWRIVSDGYNLGFERGIEYAQNTAIKLIKEAFGEAFKEANKDTFEYHLKAEEECGGEYERKL